MQLTVRAETWPIRGVFRISRGARTEARVVVVEIGDGAACGRGECVPYPRYGESVEGVVQAIEAIADDVARGMNRAALAERLPAGAARNAVDCALWDLEAKHAGQPAWRLAGLPAPTPVTSAYTVSLADPDEMAATARMHARRPLLKLKLTGKGDAERVRAVRKAAPEARLIADANESWTPDAFAELAPLLGALGVEMIEQPLPADRDDALGELDRPVPVCADESCHTSADVSGLVGRYDAVNVKLDKTGGLTEALALARTAQEAGFALMVGCMIGTSLGIAPAALLAPTARWVDLDAPLLLAEDRVPGVRFEGSVLFPPDAELWG